jgi:hypothetical protein
MSSPAPSSDPVAWKDGPLLVVRRKTDLSDRCVCCGKPAVAPPVTVKLYQSSAQTSGYRRSSDSTGLRFIIVVGDLIVAMDRKIIVGLCADHQQRRQNQRTAALVCVVAGLICLGSTVFVWRLRSGGVTRTVVAIAMVVLPILLFWLASHLARKTPGLSMSKESKDMIWIRGASPAFLEALPISDKPAVT